jgi:hypothetical protein
VDWIGRLILFNSFNSQPQAYWIIAIYDGLYACG